VWVGLDDASPVGLTGAQAALPIWAAVMQAAVRRSPPGVFAPPPGVVMASVDSVTGRMAATGCGGGPMIEEAFRAGSEPPVSVCDGTPAWESAESFAWGS
jgi:membrane carboxypeptidase/penicillin-binding protein